MTTKKAVVLLSGGLDSATTLAIALQQNYEIYALSFDYGQRHNIELNAARNIAEAFSAKEHKTATIDLRLFGGSALTDSIDVPKDRAIDDNIPITYVPARNTIFLSFALAYAETIGAFDIFIGANAVDYSGYPDCREEYFQAYTKMANLATAATDSGENGFTIHRPLINLTKAQIIKQGSALGVDYAHTISCYDPNEEGLACGECDSCQLRKKGFFDANLQDPTRYIDK
jgi:7-cyano-7-deazaguanine synthase